MEIDKNIPIPEPNYKYSSYKWKCINTMLKMEIGDSIRIKDRSLAQVKYTWLWRASRKLGLNKDAFVIKSNNPKTHRIWRIK